MSSNWSLRQILKGYFYRLVFSRHSVKKYCSLGFWFSSFHYWLLNYFFASTTSTFIDTKTCLQVCLEIVCGAYPNRKFGFASPAGLWKVVVRVMIECNCLLMLIDCFDWYKISFKFFVKALFCWLLTYVYCIYWIRVHWSWNLSLGVFANFLRAVSKSDIQIPPPQRFVEGRGEGAIYVIAFVIVNWLNIFKSKIPSSSCWLLFTLVLSVEE